MTETTSAASRALVERAREWLMAQALKDADLETVVRGACERLHAAGVPIARVQLSFSMLHPLYRGIGYTWRRGQGLQVDAYRHTQGDAKPDRLAQEPVLSSAEAAQPRPSAAAARHRRGQRVPDLRRSPPGGPDRLSRLHQQLRDGQGPGHDRLLVDRPARRLQRQRDRGAAGHPGHAGRGLQDGDARWGGEERARDLSRRPGRRARAGGPDQARRRRDHARRHRVGRPAEFNCYGRRSGGRAISTTSTPSSTPPPGPWPTPAARS